MLDQTETTISEKDIAKSRKSVRIMLPLEVIALAKSEAALDLRFGKKTTLDQKFAEIFMLGMQFKEQLKKVS